MIQFQNKFMLQNIILYKEILLNIYYFVYLNNKNYTFIIFLIFVLSYF